LEQANGAMSAKLEEQLSVSNKNMEESTLSWRKAKEESEALAIKLAAQQNALKEMKTTFGNSSAKLEKADVALQAALADSKGLQNQNKLLEQANGAMQTKIQDLSKKIESQVELNRAMESEAAELKQKYQKMSEENQRLKSRLPKTSQQNGNVVSQLAMLTKKESASQNALLANNNSAKPVHVKDVQPLDTKLKVKGESKELRSKSDLKLKGGASVNVSRSVKAGSEATKEEAELGLSNNPSPQVQTKGYSWSSVFFLLLTICLGIFLLFSYIFEGRERKG